MQHRATLLALALVACGGERRAACEAHPGAQVCVGDRAVTCDADGKVTAVDACADGCVTGAGCGTCDLAVPAALSVDVLPADARWGGTALPIAGNPGATDGQVTFDVPDGVRLLDDTGADVTAVPTASLPTTLWVSATRPLDATLGVHWDAGTGPCADADVAIDAAPRPGLAGRELPILPWFTPVDAIHAGDALAVGLDASRDPARAGATADLYVVEHRDTAAWIEHPKLVDVAGGARPVTLTDGLSVETAWDAVVAEDDAVGTAYDVVVDFDRDGKLSAGDWLDGGAAPAFSALGDLSLPGPYGVVTTEVAESTWIRSRVYQPEAALDHLPIVIISHGNGHDYTWYDYLGEHLASWGFVVVAHRNNTEPGIETSSTTTLQNTAWFVTHLDQFGLEGVADPHDIAWIGHSRGGEGVVRAYDRLNDGEDADGFTIDDVRLVSSIAPTVFNGLDLTDPHDVTYHLIAGGADGDVTGGVDCLPCQYMRIPRRGTGERLVTYLQAVSHNDFNCCGFDDGVGPELLGPQATQTITKALYLALLAWKLQDNPAGRDYFVRSWDDFHPIAADPDAVGAVSFSPLGTVLVDDFEENELVSESSSGAAVSVDGVTPDERSSTDGDRRLAWSDADPGNGMTQSDPGGAANDHGLTFDWDGPASIVFAVPEGMRDARGSAGLTLRATQQTRHPSTVAPLAFSVTAIDGDGDERTIDLASFGTLNLPYQRAGLGEGRGWSNEFESFLVPWTAFDADGGAFDRADVAAIRLDFGDGASPDAGRVGIDDLGFAPGGTP